MISKTYSEEEFEIIKNNYKIIFDSSKKEFENYAELNREVKDHLPYICSNYSDLDYDKCLEFEKFLESSREEIDLENKNLKFDNFVSNEIYTSFISNLKKFSSSAESVGNFGFWKCPKHVI